MKYDLTGAGELYPRPLKVNLLTRLPLSLLYFVGLSSVSEVNVRVSGDFAIHATNAAAFRQAVVAGRLSRRGGALVEAIRIASRIWIDRRIRFSGL